MGGSPSNQKMEAQEFYPVSISYHTFAYSLFSLRWNFVPWRDWLRVNLIPSYAHFCTQPSFFCNRQNHRIQHKISNNTKINLFFLILLFSARPCQAKQLDAKFLTCATKRNSVPPKIFQPFNWRINSTGELMRHWRTQSIHNTYHCLI